MASEKLDGGCLCGGIRYRISEPPIDAGFCHCNICRRASGVPAVAWLTVRVSGFEYIWGAAAVFPSSEGCQREFCPHCGTQMVFKAKRVPKTVDVTICSLDDGAKVEPQYHI